MAFVHLLCSILFFNVLFSFVPSLQTTHSPKFLGLPPLQGGKGIIIGVLDTGVTPDHPSFSGDGMPPPPAKWKGRCDFESYRCNNKLIGARSFDSSAKQNVTMPPIDNVGHGTHTASTAAGASVQRANTLGMAKGTARGMAPFAHLAIYKVCPTGQCSTSDVLAGIDAALMDGADIISMSLGEISSPPYHTDAIAVATFAAIQRGIFVSCAAGNSGPDSGLVSNAAPWILTVGASTIDRNLVAKVKLGNGAEYDGEALYQPSFSSTLLPLVYPESCLPGHLKVSEVKGKIVLCKEGSFFPFEMGKEVKRARGAAMILINEQIDGYTILVEDYGLPASHVSYAAGEKIKGYINATKSPTATIMFRGTVFGNPTAPAVASFSSRGPCFASPGILKPDIIGPGVNVLAAWPFPIRNDTKAKHYFNIISGTSMSCPHLSGIAALIKGAHPDWSPAAIKSAIMTSAKQLNINRKPIVDERLQQADLFAIGTGHVDPARAIDPGFVYDIQPDDYIPYLCGLGYTDKQVSVIAHKPVRCSGESSIPEGELNYPSFSVILGPPETFTRTVTNVGTDYSPYVVRIVPPLGVYVSVKPDKLNFSKLNQKATYSITLGRANSTHKVANFTQGYLRWDSKKYSVKSPISVKLT
ncbi:hypothetical protein ACJRO7_004609 [Eucalyptus globulus]|uniref:Uncharacterized protein n=1 Tax=Eucalyptus globulus TaxID=34317 RepID=A0ABD3IXM4_EUCGL